VGLVARPIARVMEAGSLTWPEQHVPVPVSPSAGGERSAGTTPEPSTTEHSTPEPAGAGPVEPGASAGLPPVIAAADAGAQNPNAAVWWRLNAAVFDSLLLAVIVVAISINYGGHWLVTPDGFLAVLVGELLYFFGCEALWGQTLGKWWYGVRVVSAGGGRPSPGAVAARTLLRIFDCWPGVASGLMTMWGTGAARRQRIGDVAARTMVVPVTGARRRSPARQHALPVFAILALLLAIPTGLRFVNALTATPASHETQREAAIVNGCNQTAPGRVDCRCLYETLRSRGGYRTDQQWEELASEIRAAIRAGDPRALPPAYVAAFETCRTTGPGARPSSG